MKIVADNKVKFLDDSTFRFAQLERLEGKRITRADLLDADAMVIRTRTKCTQSLLEGTSVKAIFTATIGFDHIDTKYLADQNIHWQNAPGCNAASVQQYIFSAFALLRQRCAYTLKDKKIAIVGVGNVGKKIEAWAKLIGMEVLRVDPIRAEAETDVEFVDYYSALAVADIVTYHTPLTREGQHATFHLFDDRALQSLKSGATIINTSRGEVIDTQAIIRGLETGKVAHAIIDVWENEPNISARLIELADIATPHIAGYSADSKLNATKASVQSLCSYFGKENTWIAPELAAPSQPEITISASADELTAACEMCLHTYDILADDSRLRQDTSGFEQQRGNYPLRREIGAFHLAATAPHAEFLKQFGVK